jgi:hypothetical protein
MNRLSSIEAFVTVIEFGSFSAAAAGLGLITSPTFIGWDRISTGTTAESTRR